MCTYFDGLNDLVITLRLIRSALNHEDVAHGPFVVLRHKHLFEIAVEVSDLHYWTPLDPQVLVESGLSLMDACVN